MKTEVTFSQNKAGLLNHRMIQHLLFGFFMFATIAFNSVAAQTQTTLNTEIEVKGIVSDETGPIPGVNIVLKGSKIGVITDKNGAFTFPNSLRSGDILVFSFLGYEKEEIKIDANTTFINLVLSSDFVEIMGAPNTNLPYKSKRSN
jgi:hypothetical protein